MNTGSKPFGSFRTLSLCLVALSAAGVFLAACKGEEKPPLTPDIINLDTSTDEGPIEAATPSEAKPASKAGDSDGAKNDTPDPTPVEEKAPAE